MTVGKMKIVIERLTTMDDTPSSGQEEKSFKYC
jgi:hypothetical protein